MNLIKYDVVTERPRAERKPGKMQSGTCAVKVLFGDKRLITTNSLGFPLITRLVRSHWKVCNRKAEIRRNDLNYLVGRVETRPGSWMGNEDR